jgi:carboxyl-terminal processing protease
LVLRHPFPFADFGEEVDYVAVFADPTHYATIASSVDFSPDLVTPRAYLTSVLDHIEARSLWRDYVNWPDVRRQALATVTGTSSLADADQAIQDALSELRNVGDRHSLFVTPAGVELWLQGDPRGYIAPTGRRLANGIGYIALPSFEGDENAALRYGTTAQRIVSEVDEEPACGWVVDLRENLGGNMYPMLAGVGALLGEGRILRWIYPDGHEAVVTYRGGHIYQDDQDFGAVSNDAPYELRKPDPPIAVLIGSQTASSGEATALAFVGREHTRLFGQRTASYTTGNSVHPLFDGSWLVLSEVWMADRTGAIHPTGVEPNEQVIDNGLRSENDDPVLQAAVDWLEQQPDCLDVNPFAISPKSPQVTSSLF